jgi:predicted membrane protein
MEQRQKTGNRHLIIGLIIVAVGVIWLLDRLQLIPLWLDDVFISWGSLFIAIGLIALFNRGNKLPGIIFIVLGTAFILAKFDFYWFNYELVWPVLVILIGLVILFRNRLGPSRDASGATIEENDPDFFEVTSVFGGGEKIVTSQSLKGGQCTAVFGGSEINLINAQVSDHHDTVIDIFAIFGGITIIVPADWEIINDVQTILGGYSDKRALSGRTNPGKRVYLRGTVIFGGGEIKAYK